MSVNKNFVVKHGLEVSTDLIIANASNKKVGIASTNPQFTLDVRGGIGVTDIYASGISTVANEFNVGSGGTVFTVLGQSNSIGVGTATPTYLLDVRSPVSTGQTALYVQGDVKITGDLNLDDINLDDATLSNIEITESLYLSNAGVSTFTGPANFNGSVNISNLQVTGVSTLGTLKVSSGVVTATSGVVTYYGDGSKLTGVVATSGGAIGVGSEASFVGSGITSIYFSGETTSVVAAGTSATVTVTPGVSLGLAIALGG